MKYLLKNLVLLCAVTLSALTVEMQTVPSNMLLKGELAPKYVESISLPFDAKLSPVATFNSVVKKGDPLFRIEYSGHEQSPVAILLDYLQQLHVMEIAEQHMQAQYELMKIEAISLKSYHEAIIDHEKKQLTLIQKKDALQELLKAYNVTLDEVEALQGQSLQDIQTYVNEKIPTVVASPISGIFVSASDTEPKNAAFYKMKTEIATIINNQSYELILHVNEKSVGQLKLGQTVDIKVPVLNKSLTGHVKNIAHYPKKIGNTHTFSILINFESIEEETLNALRVGMHCSAMINLQEEETLMIPLSYVKKIVMKNFVMLKQNGMPQLTEVTLGKTHGMDVQVLSGISAGDEIIEHY
jgi:macrolide-specific efflux system membrane fusion protein